MSYQNWIENENGDIVAPDAEQPEPDGTMLAAALELAAEGYKVFPAPPGEKKSYKSKEYCDEDWGMTDNPAELRRDWKKWPAANIGFPTGAANGCFVLDLDCKNDKDGVAWLREKEAEHGPLPETVSAQSPSGGFHLYFNMPEDFDIRNSEGNLGPGVDIRGSGGMVLVAPSEKPGVGEYEWRRPLLDAPVLDAPAWLLDALRAIEAGRSARAERAARPARRIPRRRAGMSNAEREIELAAERVRGAWDGERNGTLNRMAFWLGGAVAGGWMDEAAAVEALEDGAQDAGLETGEIRPTIASGINAGKTRPRTQEDRAGFDLSDHALALQLGEIGWDDDAKFVASRGTWIFWDGNRWAEDRRLAHMTRVREYLSETADELTGWADALPQNTNPARDNRVKWANREAAKLKDATKVSAVANLARSNPASAAVADDFDRPLHLLATPGGTVDLRTGVLRPGERWDMLSMMAAVAPAPTGAVPQRWLQFLCEVFPDDPRMIEFMQRMIGYSLTGETREHKFFFAYGGGRNGKSVLLTTLQEIFGEYGWRAPATMFMRSPTVQHRQSLAALRGKRLVLGSEIPKGATWDEALLKDISGGDTVTANRMRQNDENFRLQGKLILAGNTRPHLHGVDEAMRARLILMPFEQSFIGREDFRLPEKLRQEYPAILRWMMDGASKWYHNGLRIPRSVRDSSREYMDGEDFGLRFIQDCCKLDAEAWTARPIVTREFSDWLKTQGMNATWSWKSIIEAIERHGPRRHKRNTGLGIIGLRVRDDWRNDEGF